MFTVYLLWFSFSSYTKYYKADPLPEVSPLGESNALIEGRILFISSYSPAFMTFNNQLDGIRSQLREGYVELDIEYMDSKRFYTTENIENFRRSLQYKLENTQPYDVVIVADDNATAFAIENQETLFKGIPIIFLGVNNFDYAVEISRDPMVTGVVESSSIKETIELAQMLIPDARRVVAIVDDTNSGQADLAQFYSSYNKVDGLDYADIDMSSMEMDDFELQLASLGSDDIVLLLSAYGNVSSRVSFQKGLDLILANCQQPVFHPYYHGLGDGAAGGMVISHFEQGSKAGRMAWDILNGKQTNEIKLIAKSPNKAIFDRDVLEYFNLDPGKLPSGTIFINEDKPFIIKYGKQLLAILAVLLIQMMVIVLLIVTLIKKIRAENEYRKFRLIADRALFGTLILDLTGVVLYCNEYYAKAHGYEIAEIENRNVRMLFTEEQFRMIEEMQKELFETGRIPAREVHHKRKDGTTVIMLQSFILMDEDKKGQSYIVANASDLTRIKELEQEKSLMEENIRDQQRLNSLGVLAGGVAHEINNPINGIMNYAQLIIDADSQNQEIHEYSNEIINESTRVAEIVKSLLQFSRQGTQEYTTCNPKDIIEQTLRLIKTTVIKDDIKLLVNLPGDLPWIRCRGQQIRQVFMNLLTNARDSLELSGKENKQIIITARTEEIFGIKYVRIIVEDNGTGINDEAKDRVFEPFFTTKDRNKGTGLGLSISYGIVRDHNGNLTFTTQKGKGTSFIIDIPAVQDSSD